MRAILNLKPEDPQALRQLHWLQGRLRDFGGASESINRLDALGEEVAQELSELLLSLMAICEWANSEAFLSRLLSRLATGDPCIVSPFALLGTIDCPRKHYQMATCIASALTSHTASMSRPKLARRLQGQNEKLRIGYLCGDFYNHPTSLLLVEVIENHDRERFYIIGYDYSPADGSAERKRILAAFDQVVRLADDGPEETAAKIAADALDILVDLKGYTKGTRSELLTLRPAPTQINFLGYVSSQAGDWIGYVIADQTVLPLKNLQYWREKALYMPDCYYPNGRSRPIPEPPTSEGRLAQGLPEVGFVFTCFNSPYKIRPFVFDIWMELLRAVDGSVLWLYEENAFVANNLRSEAQRSGVDADRLIFAPPLSFSEHIDRHAYSDLFLDTYPYGAHTTGADALWAGVPMVTLEGSSFPSRVASSLLNAVGLSELACKNKNDYFSLALELASNPERLATLRKRLVGARFTSPLFDPRRFATNLERGYKEAVRLYRAGKAPTNIVVSNI